MFQLSYINKNNVILKYYIEENLDIAKTNSLDLNYKDIIKIIDNKDLNENVINQKEIPKVTKII